MGYELHITRKAQWFDDGEDISEAEWRAYVEADPEMTMSGVAEVILPDGGVLRYENPDMAEWRTAAGEIVWFDCRRGRVAVKSPDEETIHKMVSVATALRAQVQGDEGEVYPLDAKNPQLSPKSVGRSAEFLSTVLNRWPLWKTLVVAFLLGCILLALKLLLLK